jgi:hypothetical protein
MTFCIAGLAVAVALVTSSATPDNRDMSNGNLIHTWPYSDHVPFNLLQESTSAYMGVCLFFFSFF